MQSVIMTHGLGFRVWGLGYDSCLSCQPCHSAIYEAEVVRTPFCVRVYSSWRFPQCPHHGNPVAQQCQDLEFGSVYRLWPLVEKALSYYEDLERSSVYRLWLLMKMSLVL